MPRSLRTRRVWPQAGTDRAGLPRTGSVEWVPPALVRSSPTPLIGVVGDLVDDVVVRLLEPINTASDTASVIHRRRGGSGANVAAAVVVVAGGAARFIGQVGADDAGAGLVADMQRVGVDTRVRQAGRTGTVVVLLASDGERTMLTDRGACADLTDPDPSWLDGLAALHVPLYSLLTEPMATTAATLIGWAHGRGLLVSVDASSVGAIEGYGVDAAAELIGRQAPGVLFCNADEAAALAPLDRLGAEAVVVKRGGGAATVLRTHIDDVTAAAEAIADVRDTTGAGDAFAAGYLVAVLRGADASDALTNAHRTAADTIRIASARSSG